MPKSSSLSVASFFAGAGGLDLGFKLAGFNVPWANEYDKTIWETYEANHPETVLDHRSIVDINGSDIPKVNGFIGGPPCQSWSEAGSLRGIGDHRGQLFFEYLRLIEAKKPDFFLLRMFLAFCLTVIPLPSHQYLQALRNLATT